MDDFFYRAEADPSPYPRKRWIGHRLLDENQSDKRNPQIGSNGPFVSLDNRRGRC
ncbi:MAG: hypothetical protein ACM3WU_10675 [Bacillota bacterium]